MRNITQPDNTTALLIEEDKRMALAHQIAEAATCLDCLKRTNAPQNVMEEARNEAPLLVHRLEKIVGELAGDRLGEIYSDNESEGEDLIERVRRYM